jgi:hypothetical protein
MAQEGSLRAEKIVTEANRRRSDRIFSLLPIRVAGADASGAEFVEDTQTVSLSECGACVSLSRSLQPNSQVVVTNQRNGIQATFRVVGEVRHIFGDRGEWGLELVDLAVPIWGIDFNPPPVEFQPKVMIRCSRCQDTRLSLLNSIEYDVLLYTGMITRQCDHCGEAMRWMPSEPAAAEAKKRAPQPGAERRRQRRRNLTMLMRIRRASGETEVVQTVDASASGICFVSRRRYQVGEDVFLRLPPPRGEMPVETKGRIVRSVHISEGQHYGVSYL